MNRLQLILLVLSTATFSPFVFSETTISPTKYEFYGQESKRHKSMLEVNNSSDHKIKNKSYTNRSSIYSQPLAFISSNFLFNSSFVYSCESLAKRI